MFTSLTSYLWGSNEVTEEEPAAPERPSSPNLKTSPTESDDWILVDKSRGNSPQRLETSSMENLLIEHPSMSVYGPRHRQSSTGHESDLSQSSNSSTDNVPPPSTVRHTVIHAPRRPRAVAARAGMLAQSAKAAQVGQYKYQTRQISRSALERRNRLSHFVPATKRSRVRGNMKQPAARSFSKRC